MRIDQSGIRKLLDPQRETDEEEIRAARDELRIKRAGRLAADRFADPRDFAARSRSNRREDAINQATLTAVQGQRFNKRLNLADDTQRRYDNDLSIRGVVTDRNIINLPSSIARLQRNFGLSRAGQVENARIRAKFAGRPFDPTDEVIAAQALGGQPPRAAVDAIRGGEMNAAQEGRAAAQNSFQRGNAQIEAALNGAPSAPPQINPETSATPVRRTSGGMIQTSGGIKRQIAPVFAPDYRRRKRVLDPVSE